MEILICKIIPIPKQIEKQRLKLPWPKYLRESLGENKMRERKRKEKEN